MKRKVQVLLLGISPLLAMAGLANAQNNDAPVVAQSTPGDTAQPNEGTAGATGLPTPGLESAARLSAEVISAFLTNPAGLLSAYPTAGEAMERYVALLAGSDVRTIDVLIALAGNPQATRLQVRAIAEGLAAAALAAEQTAPDYAAFILAQVAASGNAVLTGDFNVALRDDGDDIDTAELPGAGAGGGGGGGSVGGGTLSGGAGGVGVSGATGGSTTASTSSGSYSVGGSSVSGDVTEVEGDVSPTSIGG